MTTHNQRVRIRLFELIGRKGGHRITRVKLTLANNYVMVFHYNGGQYGIPTRVDKLDASSQDNYKV
jgi:hypothetical protein